MNSSNSTRTALRRSGVLTASSAALWLVMAGPAYWLAGATGLEGLSYAALLCLVPGCLVFFAAGWLGANNQAVTFLAGTGLRMLTVLIGALVIHEIRADLGLRQFFGWLVLFYSVTLVVETLLIVKLPTHVGQVSNLPRQDEILPHAS